MRPYGARLTGAILGVAFAAAFEVLKPWPLKVVIDNVLRGRPLQWPWVSALSPRAMLVAACVTLVLLYVAIGILNVINNYVTIAVGHRMVNDLRARLFDHLQRLSLSFHRRREIGDLMVRVAYDTFSVQTITMNGFFPVLSSLVMLAGMFVVMARMDLGLTLAAVAVVPALFALIALASTRIDRIATGARARESRLYDIAHRALSAIQVVQAFACEAESYREFVESSGASLGAMLRLYIFQTIYAGSVGVMLALGTAFVIYLGASHVLAGELTIGELIVFTTYLASLYSPINQLFQTYGQVEAAKAGFKRCLELLEIEPEISDRPGARPLANVRGELEFAEVSFGHQPDRLLLESISFRARPGDRIALVGPSGAGKTTLASLLLRFYEPRQGAVLIDGRDVREVTLDSLRRNIATVLQPPLVLSGTLRMNIALGNAAATDREIRQAAEMARLGPLLERLADGIDTVVGRGGQSLSEGEGQRVAIARVLLKNAPILVLDEPTSALDAETEALVLAAMEEAMRGRTTLVIAHRLSTVTNANRILVLNQGRIVEDGTFAELLSRRGFFSHLYNLQMSQPQTA